MPTELKRATTPLDRIEELLGENARTLLDHKSEAIPKDQLNLPGPDFIDRVWTYSDRSPAALRSQQSLFDRILFFRQQSHVIANREQSFE